CRRSESSSDSVKSMASGPYGGSARAHSRKRALEALGASREHAPIAGGRRAANLRGDDDPHPPRRAFPRDPLSLRGDGAPFDPPRGDDPRVRGPTEAEG